MVNKVQITTYGTNSKRAVPAAYVWVDCTGISNPYEKVNSDAECLKFVRGAVNTGKVVGQAITGILNTARYHSGEAVRVNVFCSFGQHRSPAVATLLSQMLTAIGFHVTITHLDKKEQKTA